MICGGSTPPARSYAIAYASTRKGFPAMRRLNMQNDLHEPARLRRRAQLRRIGPAHVDVPDGNRCRGRVRS